MSKFGRKFLLCFALFFIFGTGNLKAGMPVHDAPGNIKRALEYVQTIVKWVDKIRRFQQQLDIWKNMYATMDISKLTTTALGGLSETLKSDLFDGVPGIKNLRALSGMAFEQAKVLSNVLKLSKEVDDLIRNDRADNIYNKQYQNMMKNRMSNIAQEQGALYEQRKEAKAHITQLRKELAGVQDAKTKNAGLGDGKGKNEVQVYTAKELEYLRKIEEMEREAEEADRLARAEALLEATEAEAMFEKYMTLLRYGGDWDDGTVAMTIPAMGDVYKDAIVSYEGYRSVSDSE